MATPLPAKKKKKDPRLSATPAALDPVPGTEAESLAEAELSGLSGLMDRMDRCLRRSPLACAHGLRVSAQANEFTYCLPRDNDGPYEAVELGFPSQAVERWAPWAEDPSDLTGTVYGRVPVLAVAYAIAEHGGRDEAQSDWEARSMCGDGKVIKGCVASPYAPARLDVSDPAALREAMLAWARQAVLGSPAAEKAARFEVGLGEDVLGDWTACMSAFLAAGFESAAENDTRAWIKTLSIRADIAKVTAYPSDVARPRRSL